VTVKIIVLWKVMQCSMVAI